jgi:hypothetical protein
MPALIRYRLPPGDRFTIVAWTHERIELSGRCVMDVEASFALACEVVEASDGIATIRGRFENPKLTGQAITGVPDLGPLDGTIIVVRKGTDGRVHDVAGAGAVEAMFGGLTAANALMWFAVVFAPEPAREWTITDRWMLRADRTPLALPLPLYPAVDVVYRHHLRSATSVDVDVRFSGGGRSGELGLDLAVSGSGVGEVELDRASGKLASSTKEATLDLVPRAFRRGALALPPLRVTRRSRAGFRT